VNDIRCGNKRAVRRVDPSYEPPLNQYFMRYGFQLEVHFHFINFSVTESNLKPL